MKTAWWCKNRRCITDEEIERRQSRIKDRSRKYEPPRSDEDGGDVWSSVAGDYCPESS